MGKLHVRLPLMAGLASFVNVSQRLESWVILSHPFSDSFCKRSVSCDLCSHKDYSMVSGFSNKNQIEFCLLPPWALMMATFGLFQGKVWSMFHTFLTHLHTTLCLTCSENNIGNVAPNRLWCHDSDDDCWCCYLYAPGMVCLTCSQQLRALSKVWPIPYLGMLERSFRANWVPQGNHGSLFRQHFGLT